MTDIEINQPANKPWRLTIAQKICRPLPPIISQRVRSWIYPREIAAKDKYEFVENSITGSKFIGKTNDFFCHPFAVHGYYYWRAWAIALAVCSRGDSIIEIGANVGTETIGFSDIVGKSGNVIAFEPLPNNIKVLEIALAESQWKNINIHPYVVVDTDKIVRFFPPKSLLN